MNGSLRMHKSYTNRSNHKVKIPSNIVEFFSADNNLKLDYYKEFDWKKLVEPFYNVNNELKNAIELFRLFRENLDKKSIDDEKESFFEQKVMREVVGSQDQTSASFGGFNKIIFNKNNSISVKKISSKKNVKKLNENLILIYTGINRTAHKIANQYVNKLTTAKKKHIDRILTYVKEGEDILRQGDIDDFGRLLNDAWMEKKALSSLITNSKINEIYEEALKHGALGGKLLGAGGGGFLLMYMKKNERKNFFKKNKKLINIPFKFTTTGSEIIFDQLTGEIQ